MKKLLIIALIAAGFIACSKGGDKSSPAAIVEQFILAAEAGDMSHAASLLAAKNDVDYFDKFSHLGKDMLFIDYDYKGNDKVLSIEYEELSRTKEVAAVRECITYHAMQDNKFCKSIILHNEGSEQEPKWRIFSYPGLYQVKVRP